jgi:acyl dehydratase
MQRLGTDHVIREDKVLYAGLSEGGCEISGSGHGYTKRLMPLFLEDLQVGQRFSSGEYRMTEERMKAFAAEFDPQPFHLDEAAGAASMFKGLSGSGWHTAAISMRLLVAGGLQLANGVIGLGGEIAWPRPTRAGDILRVESEILEIRPSRSKPNQGIVSVRSTTRNQHGEEVQIFTAKFLVFRRRQATA